MSTGNRNAKETIEYEANRLKKILRSAAENARYLDDPHGPLLFDALDAQQEVLALIRKYNDEVGRKPAPNEGTQP